MTTAALLAHYVLLEFPPEDSEPVFTLDEVADILEDTANLNAVKWGTVLIGGEVVMKQEGGE